ncbi:hypothetical protein CEXT_99251 [Caerostris extrusa]|uniref:Uncharacterized protein n=1 Tax=Caerostris extrusa TaxID=172846 RepID=A0AAV4NBX5_CAEEX|nr:hypothetical protein CEXT_99251 [Caerostris extrusa]
MYMKTANECPDSLLPALRGSSHSAPSEIPLLKPRPHSLPANEQPPSGAISKKLFSRRDRLLPMKTSGWILEPSQASAHLNIPGQRPRKISNQGEHNKINIL